MVTATGRGGTPNCSRMSPAPEHTENFKVCPLHYMWPKKLHNKVRLYVRVLNYHLVEIIHSDHIALATRSSHKGKNGRCTTWCVINHDHKLQTVFHHCLNFPTVCAFRFSVDDCFVQRTSSCGRWFVRHHGEVGYTILHVLNNLLQ